MGVDRAPPPQRPRRGRTGRSLRRHTDADEVVSGFAGCAGCRRAHSDDQRARGSRAQQRLPVEMRQQLLDAIYGGQPFRSALGDLGLL
jgi:hypothetical protein